MAARSGNADDYTQMIQATVNDYDQVITQLATVKFNKAKHKVVIGYSMGAQMGIILSAQNEHVSHLITMVPPAVKNVPVVSPIAFVEKVAIPWLLILASDDQFSTPEDNKNLVANASKLMEHKTFSSGHMLPSDYVTEVTHWLKNIK
jgi:alpha/beta superfamily hydrolase